MIDYSSGLSRRPAVLFCLLLLFPLSGAFASENLHKQTVKIKRLPHHLRTFNLSSGASGALSSQAEELLESLISAFHDGRHADLYIENHALNISIPVSDPTESRVFGEVAASSHFPYDFSWYPDHQLYRLRITADSSGIHFQFFNRLYASYFLLKFGDNLKGKNRAFHDFLGAFPLLVRMSHKKTIVHGLESAANDPDLIFRSMSFFPGFDDQDVRISADLVSYKNKQEALEILLDKLPFLEYARSAVSFGAMILSHYFPDQIPDASATLINRLFSPRHGNGKGEDGRTQWSLTHEF